MNKSDANTKQKETATALENGHKKTALGREQRTITLTFALLICAAITGFSTYFVNGFSTWQQWSSLIHSANGIVLAFAIAPYIWHHFRRTLGYRRPLVTLSGLLAVSIVLGLMASGIKIALFGRTESSSWIYETHVYTAFSFLLLFFIHALLHTITFPEKRKKSGSRKFASFDRVKVINLFSVSIFSFIIIMLGSLLAKFTPSPFGSEPAAKNYTYQYGEHPFRPSQTETYHDNFIDPKEIYRSHNCATCHEEIATQWRSSAHKQAASDPTYVTNVSLLAKNMGIAATRYCEGCHAPGALLTGELSQGGEHGGIVDTPAHVEGVGCLGCHGISKITHLKGVASYEYTQPSRYLFTGYENPLANTLRNFLIESNPKMHRQEMGSEFQKQPQVCATCHTQFMDKDMNNWGWVKMQDEYSAWLDSHFSQQTNQVFSESSITRCQDCHMPLVKTNDPASDKNGMSRSHRFIGANTMLSFLAKDDKQFQLTKNFLQSGKMRISIEEPNRIDATQTLRALDENIRGFAEAPYYYYLGEEATIKTVVTNQGVGHNFPGGTIDINEAWVSFVVTDASNQIIYQSGFINKDNSVDEDAHFYRSQPIDKDGNLVWRHDLFNRVGEAYKRVVPAGKSDIVSFTFKIPAWAKGPLIIASTLKYRKLNDRYARWALKDKYEALPIIDMARDTLVIPIRIRRETISKEDDTASEEP